jgi:flagellar hook-associated protein 1 FlgK
MGLLNTALMIGRSAVAAQQAAIQVTGNNIANAATPGYTRQAAHMTPEGMTPYGNGLYIGRGVKIDQIERQIDAALEQRIQTAMGDKSGLYVQMQTLDRVESLLNEMTDEDLSTQMSAFFNGLADLQNNPQDLGVRSAVAQQGAALTDAFRSLREQLDSVREDLNNQITAAVGEINRLTAQIGDINARIADLEATQADSAHGLRDERDQMLRDLSELIDISVAEQPNGSMYVFVGNDSLVFDSDVRALELHMSTDDGVQTSTVHFADNGGEVPLWGGKLTGLIAARDQIVTGVTDQLDTVAAALINEFNKIHSSGVGLVALGEVEGTNTFDDATAALADCGLDLTPVNGTFLVHVRNKVTGQEEVTQIAVDANGVGTDSTIDSIVADLDAVANLAATVNPQQTVTIGPASGDFEWYVTDDTTGLLAALGINTFFTGSDSRSIAVNSLVADDVQRIAAATSMNSGDNSNVARMTGLAGASLDILGGQSLTSTYNAMVTDVGVQTNSTTKAYQAADAFVQSLEAQKQTISGVSLDEEAINLLSSQRAFQGAARYLQIVDQMLEIILNL